MFIDRGAKTPLAPFGEAEWFWIGEALVEFRSSERSWYELLARVYKHLTPNGVKTRYYSDGALFFHVMSGVSIEGVANLNATAMVKRSGVHATELKAEPIGA